MAERLAIPSKEIALKIVGPTDSFLASRVQRLNLNTDLPSTYIDELGNPNHAGQSIDIPAITASFSAMDVGIKVFSVLTGTDPTAYPGAGVDISSLGEVDAIVLVKSATVSDYVKTGSIRRMQVRDFAFNYSVDGDSTEEYTLIGSENRWFTKDVVVDLFETGTTSFTLSETPITLKNGNECISVILDSNYLTEVASSPATGEYSVSGTTLTTYDTRTSQVMALYQADPSGDNWSDVSDTTMPAAIKGKDVKVYLAGGEINRVQSVTINGNMNITEVREMGNRNVVGYQSQVPTIEGTITLLDTDTDLMELFTVGNLVSGDTEFQLGLDTTTSGIPLEIALIDPNDITDPYTVLKTVYLPEISVVGDSHVSNVNNNVTHTFNFRSDDSQCLIYSGARS